MPKIGNTDGLLSTLLCSAFQLTFILSQIFDTPAFLVEPPAVVYQQSHYGQSIALFEFQLTEQGAWISLVLTSDNDARQAEITLPVITRSTYDASSTSNVDSSTNSAVYAIVNPPSTLSDSYRVQIFNLNTPSRVHVLATFNGHGTLRSRPIRIEQQELRRFPRYADETASFNVGSIGYLVCHLPHSRPSLPSVYFYHNGHLLNFDGNDRYSLVYLGGDWSGRPWNSSSNLQSASQPSPSAAILFIRSLRLEDAGQYRCGARLGHLDVTSDQNVYLNISKPEREVRPKLSFSTADPQLSYLFHDLKTAQDEEMIDRSNTRTFLLNPNIDFTLFCLFEAAPIVSTRWFHTSSADNIEYRPAFGHLIIRKVTKQNSGVYECTTGTHDRVNLTQKFIIEVKDKQRLIIHLSSRHTLVKGCLELNCTIAANISSSPTVVRRKNLHTKLNWFHNGVAVLVGNQFSDDGTATPNLVAEASVLRKVNPSQSDEGIYQCWSEAPDGTWSSVVTTVKHLDEDAGFKEKSIVKGSDLDGGVTKEFTNEGLTGHLTCNLSNVQYASNSLLSPLFLSQSSPPPHVEWYRGEAGYVPLATQLASQNGREVKYLSTRVSDSTNILSILNPEKGKDDGIYFCKIFHPNSRQLLGEMKFELIVSTGNELESSSEKLPRPTFNSLRPVLTDQSDVPKGPHKVQITESNNQDIKNEIHVDQSRVFLVAPFLPLIHLSWSVASNLKSHGPFRIEYRSATPLTRDKSRERSNEEHWSSAQRVAGLSTNNHSVLLNGSNIFQSGHIYSFRVTTNDITSEWSSAVDFAHILPGRLTLDSIEQMDPETVHLLWNDTTVDKAENTFQTRRTKPVKSDYVAVFRQVAVGAESCSDFAEKLNVDNVDVITQRDGSIGFKGISQQPLTNASRSGGSILQLQPNKSYCFSVYKIIHQNIHGEVTTDTVLYSFLSNELFYHVHHMKIANDAANKKTKIDNGTVSRHSNVFGTDKHIVIVVFGSLAGITMVSFVVLLCLCMCRNLRLQQIKSTNSVKSSYDQTSTYQYGSYNGDPRQYLTPTYTNPPLLNPGAGHRPLDSSKLLSSSLIDTTWPCNLATPQSIDQHHFLPQSINGIVDSLGNTSIWRTKHPLYHNLIDPLQLRLLQHSLQFRSVGGQLNQWPSSASQLYDDDEKSFHEQINNQIFVGSQRVVDNITAGEIIPSSQRSTDDGDGQSLADQMSSIYSRVGSELTLYKHVDGGQATRTVHPRAINDGDQHCFANNLPAMQHPTNLPVSTTLQNTNYFQQHNPLYPVVYPTNNGLMPLVNPLIPNSNPWMTSQAPAPLHCPQPRRSDQMMYYRTLPHHLNRIPPVTSVGQLIGSNNKIPILQQATSNRFVPIFQSRSNNDPNVVDPSKLLKSTQENNEKDKTPIVRDKLANGIRAKPDLVTSTYEPTDPRRLVLV